MGRPPCCDKVGVKKGPWTPEEDIMLVSYVQEHGPGNWRSVPTNTGLRRCSKSCRLRWTNYLRPGIRRGEFTDDEEKMIIQLQALLGNKWAAIASYLPERTDNDIKNYWNTHLKKKLKKLQSGSSSSSDDLSKDGFSSSSSSSHLLSRGQWEKRLQTDIHMAKQALHDALSLEKPVFESPDHNLTPLGGYYGSVTKPSQAGPTYASSTENIARLLKGFMKISPKNGQTKSTSSTDQHSFNSNAHNLMSNSNSCEEVPCVDSKSGIDLSVAFQSLFGFESNFDSSNSDFSQSNNTSPEASLFQDESKPDISALAPLSMFENWLLDHDQGGGVLHGKVSDLTNFAFDESPDLF